MEQLQEATYFPTKVYAIKKPEFLEAVKEVSARYLEESKKTLGEGQHMTVMTATYAHEESIKDFAEYVSQTAWNILHSQGYAVDQLVTFFTEMWTQEHNNMSSMETHVHGRGAQISAFYFLDAPKSGCKMVIHDPRPGKVIINLPEANNKEITMASHQVVFTPEPGALILTNAWLPHSFSKNFSKEPVLFVHMNLSVMLNPNAVKQEKTVEVV